MLSAQEADYVISDNPDIAVGIAGECLKSRIFGWREAADNKYLGIDFCIERYRSKGNFLHKELPS